MFDLHFALLKAIDDRQKMESGPIKSISPGPRPSESCLEKRETSSLPLLVSSSPEVDVSSHPTSGCIKPTAAGEPEFISPSATKAQTYQVISCEESLPEASPRLSASPSVRAVNGVAEPQTPSSYEEPEVQEAVKMSCEIQDTSFMEESGQEVPVALEELQAEHLPSLAAHVPLIPAVQASLITSSATSVLAPPPGLAPLVQSVVLEASEQNKTSDDVQPKAQDASESQTQNNSRKFIPGMYINVANQAKFKMTNY